jgi:hypothetical protein
VVSVSLRNVLLDAEWILNQEKDEAVGALDFVVGVP